MARDKLFRTIDKDLLSLISMDSTRTYTYHDANGEARPILEKRIDYQGKASFKLDDQTCLWDAQTQPVELNIHLKVSGLCALFSSDHAICYSDTVLGFGIVWKPSKSRLKHAVKLFDFTKDTSDIDIEKDSILLPEMVSNTDFNWVIYIVKAGTPNDENYFGNQEGLVLGSGNLWTLINEGKGSLFPIADYKDPSAPLWKIRCSFSDIYEDMFDEENVCILLNPANRLYSKTKVDDESYDEDFLFQTLGDALTLLILQIKAKNNDNPQIDFSRSGCQGSIISALLYFKDMLDIKINGSPSELSESVHAAINVRRMRE
ncbi:MAG: hypothetical protein LKM30_04130 [Bacilli bacterium]|jgi:hypothetical protein|nr:hypothetical protein [Bacilli bacterium]